MRRRLVLDGADPNSDMPDVQPRTCRTRHRLLIDLSGVVAVVSGASRGAGRAIAIVLAEAGATVYASARSTRAAPSAPGREGTLDETAEAAEQRGGVVIPVRCDHTAEQDVVRLFERVRRERGRLDLLVNNAWGGYEQPPDEPAVPFSSRYAAPLLVCGRERRPALIVHTIAWAFGAFLGNVLYDTAKAATARLAYGSAQQLKPHQVAVIALAPGHLGVTETPEYLGRAVAVLAADTSIMNKTGALLTVGELAREYGFTDVDGSQPEPWGLSVTSRSQRH